MWEVLDQQDQMQTVPGMDQVAVMAMEVEEEEAVEEVAVVEELVAEDVRVGLEVLVELVVLVVLVEQDLQGQMRTVLGMDQGDVMEMEGAEG